MKTCLRACQRSAFVSFVIFNVREYNWKCLLEMSSRKISVNRIFFPESCWKAGVEDRGLVCRALRLKTQGCLSPNSKGSRFPRKECALGGREGSRMHPRGPWGEPASLHPSEMWLRSESGLGISRLITLIVWFTFSGIFFALELFPVPTGEGLHFQRLCWTSLVS